MGEVDSFDLNAESSAYSSAITHHHPLGYPTAPLSKSWNQNNQNNNTTSQEESINENQDPENTRRWKRYRDSAGIVCNQREFFFTKKSFFGIGPRALRNGDCIAILLGADVPFVIREVLDDEDDEDDDEVEMLLRMMGNNDEMVRMDRKFWLVGECYVDGLMQGQGLKGVETLRDITFI